ncbi:MAG: hypothetical protein IT364_20850, partial [Candidatus Hydrogenedentes bacterium]|nr:hypothetical protein [Candidatus Hydrogenedentota bacterium]
MPRIGVIVLLSWFSVSSLAELQDVQVGGQLHIRGRYWTNTYVGAAGGPLEV